MDDDTRLRGESEFVSVIVQSTYSKAPPATLWPGTPADLLTVGSQPADWRRFWAIWSQEPERNVPPPRPVRTALAKANRSAASQLAGMLVSGSPA
ncbi:MAG: hypothetical protein IPO51_03840 [Dehalococcoidia bacterium]|nr:hypothetical protein [Dehalococcoidia bacterium]